MRRKSAIYTHRREDDYHCHLYVGVPPLPGGGGCKFPQLTHGYSIWVAVSPLNVTGFFFHHVTRRRRNNSNRVSGLSCDIMHSNVGRRGLPWGTSHSWRRAVWRQWHLLPTSHSGGMLYRRGRHVRGWARSNMEKRLGLGVRRTLISFFIHFWVRWWRMLSNLWSKEEDKDKLSIVISFYGLPIYGTIRDLKIQRRWQRRKLRLKN